MHNSEWSLVFFTLLGQFSAGLVFCMLIVSRMKHSTASQDMEKLIGRGIYIATLGMIAALIISFLHLAYPLSALYALSNLKQSWLSREILMVSAFTGMMMALSIWWGWLRKSKKQLSSYLLIVTLVGFLMVFSMGRIYMIPTVPAWDSISTLIAFFISTLLLGATFILTLYHKSVEWSADMQKEQTIVQVLISLILLAIVMKLVNNLIIIPLPAQDNIAFMAEAGNELLIRISWMLWPLGLLLLVLQNFSPPGLKKLASKYSYLPFLLIAIAEIAERALFYSAYFRVGI